MKAEHERFMRAALAEAKRAREMGNMAAGSVIVRDDEILARGCNEVNSSFDVSAHAEAVALRNLTTGRRQLNTGMQADSGPFAGAWGDVGKMLRSDVLAMQKALVAKGYDVGKVDGLPGYKTRRSLGDWQAKSGLAPTCYPDASLKTKLR